MTTADEVNNLATRVATEINAVRAEIDTKAADSSVVKLTGDQTVAGVKTFSSSPNVPDSSFSIAKTSSLQSALDGKQPLDSDLTAVAALSSNGIVVKTGSGTAAVRSVAGSGPVSVSDGDGVAGNPTISVASASATAQGVVELATSAETTTGTDTTRAVTPAGLASALGNYVDNDIVITDPTAHPVIGRVEIQADGSSTSSWPNRWEWLYKAVAGVAKIVQWVNEYGEFRVAPATSNTVALRAYAARDATEYTARSSTVPTFEVADQRDGVRTTEFGVLKGGKIVQRGYDTGTVYVLEASEDETDIPADLPSGTFIVRKLT